MCNKYFEELFGIYPTFETAERYRSLLSNLRVTKDVLKALRDGRENERDDKQIKQTANDVKLIEAELLQLTQKANTQNTFVATLKAIAFHAIAVR